MDPTDGSTRERKPAFRLADAIPFLECNREWRPDWLVKPLIQRNAVNLLLGAPKQRKSTLRSHLLAAGLTGSPACGVFPVVQKIERVLICLGEENEHAEATRLAQSLRGVGADPDKAAAQVRIVPPLRFFLDTDGACDQLMSDIDREQIELVVFDPLVGFHRQEENQSGGMHRVMQYMRALTTVTTVLIVHHTAKPQPGLGKVSLGYRARGSSAIPGAYDVGLLLEDGPRGLRRLEIEARYDAADPVLMDVVFGSDVITWTHHGGEGPVTDIMKELEDHTGWCRVAYLAAQTGHSKAVVGKMLHKLLETAKVERRERKGKGGTGFEWKLVTEMEQPVMGPVLVQ